MAQSTFANSRGIAHKGSGGMSIAFPDVCKTQVGPAVVPIPYPNIGMASDTDKGPKAVKTDKKMPMVKGAIYKKSTGDEPGIHKGLISSKTKGECEFMMYSFDVKFEGKNACRMGDPLFHNKKNIMG
ncbi:DUF4150 domain-containing protein [Colwellia echini]|uniref:DUF4150 domain-containing protein n=1 Tax=Colwellia echini TaxID=1982103 RepID=A0ABY3MTG9_9GAMM|nr:DUF4150 domain-containing protein [Colwellia echini]TYK64485.1 DUF4150 domain-containing protein [Colwellia echini]